MTTDDDLLVFERNDRFGRAWAAGERPAIRAFLDDLAESTRGKVFEALLVKDLQARGRLGEPVHAEDYLAEWPQYREVIVARLAGQTPGPVRHPPAVAPPPALPAFDGYETVRLLGAGGQGNVYLVRHQETGVRYAVKSVAAGAGASAVVRGRFRAEADLTARIRHPYVARVVEVNERHPVPYLVMEFVGGQTLEARYRSVRPTPAEAALLTALIADAVEYAHRAGVVHRDLKPSNVITASPVELKVVDFGVARDLWADRTLTATAATLGSPAYMAPEQIGGSEHATERSDVFALGAVLYFLLTGQPPFPGAVVDESGQVSRGRLLAPAERVPDVDPVLESICLKCLLRDPNARYPSAAALRQDLWAYQMGRPVSRLVAPAPAENPAPPTPAPKPTVGDRAASAAVWVLAVWAGFAVMGPVLPVVQQVEPLATLRAWNARLVAALPWSDALPEAGSWPATAIVMGVVGLGVWLIPAFHLRRTPLWRWVANRRASAVRTPLTRGAAVVVAAVTVGRRLLLGLLSLLAAAAVVGAATPEEVLAWGRWALLAVVPAAAVCGYAIGLPPEWGGMWVRTYPAEWLTWNVTRAAGVWVACLAGSLYAVPLAAAVCHAVGGRLPGTGWGCAEAVAWLVAGRGLYARLQRYRPERVVVMMIAAGSNRSRWGYHRVLIPAITGGALMAGAMCWVGEWCQHWLTGNGIAPPGLPALLVAAFVFGANVGLSMAKS